jgi:hypothetical protein
MTSDAWAETDTKMSDSESARAEAEAAHHAESRRRTARVLAACAQGVDEFRTLAAMLGLNQADVEAARGTKARRRRTAA